MGPGYEIGASLANSSAAGSNPFEEDGTTFIFGNDNNPSTTGEATPDTTSTATATTALPGGTAISSNGVSGPNAPGAAASSGSLTTWLLVAAVAIAVLAYFKKS